MAVQMTDKLEDYFITKKNSSVFVIEIDAEKFA